MKYVFFGFLGLIFLFVVFSGLVAYRTYDGSLDVCVAKFEECVMNKDDLRAKAVKVFVCSNKAFVCNVKGVYQSFFDKEAMDKEYNDYMQKILNKAIEEKAKVEETSQVKDDDYELDVK